MRGRYAPDDAIVPPSHGKWLGDHWLATAQRPTDVSVRTLAPGYGHLAGSAFEWPAFLAELMVLARSNAPQIAGYTRC